MVRVVLVSTSYELQEGLDKINSDHSPGQFGWESTASFAQEATFWANVDVLILEMPEDPNIQAAFIDRLKAQVPTNKRIIILAPTLGPLLQKVSSRFEKTRLLKTPAPASAVYRTLVDLTTEYPVGQQQIHPRYLTDIDAEVISDMKSVRKAAKIKNLSVGGAYFEVLEDKASFARSDMVRLTIGLSGGKSYSFDAKVVWLKPIPGVLAFGFGCSFLNKDQVYENLLAQVSRGK